MYSTEFGSISTISSINIYAIPGNLGYYFIGDLTRYSTICKYLQGQSSSKCQTIYSISSSGFSSIILSSNQFYVSGELYSDNKKLILAKITYGSSSFDWGVSIQSSSGKNASSAFQGVVLSSDKSKLYIVFPFGSFTYTDASGLNVDQIVYFITLSASTGSSIGTSYKLSSGASMTYGAVLAGDYLVSPFYSYSSKLLSFFIIYNTATSVFSFKYFNGFLCFPTFSSVTNK